MNVQLNVAARGVHLRVHFNGGEGLVEEQLAEDLEELAPHGLLHRGKGEVVDDHPESAGRARGRQRPPELQHLHKHPCTHHRTCLNRQNG
jgi:DNA-binding HxlR family transcriptional regulator